MLTLFPKIKADAAPAVAPAIAPEPSSNGISQDVEDLASTAKADVVTAEAAAAHAPPDQPIEILAEISLIKSSTSLEPSAPPSETYAAVTASQIGAATEVPVSQVAAAPAEPLDIGEWESASAEPEPVIATKSETVFEAFCSALHSHDGQTEAATKPVVPATPQSSTLEVSNAAGTPAEQMAPKAALLEPPIPAAIEVSHATEISASPASVPSQEASAPLVETPEDLLAALAIETPAEPAPASPVAAEPTSPVDPALRATLVSRGKGAAAKGGSFFVLPRISEPEAMDDSAEVDAYASAAAQSHLDAIDDTFVAHAELLLKGRERGRALDIGTGPGQIVIKLGYHLSRWKFVAVDRSKAMIARAREALGTAPELAGRVEFAVADGNKLDFPDRSFDLVICNSVLHHLEDPQKLFSEMARLVKPGGALLLRDLVRPTRLGFGHHVRKYGKHYAGEMKRLYIASLRAAYTEEELQGLLGASALTGLVTVFRHRNTHIGFQRVMSVASRKI